MKGTSLLCWCAAGILMWVLVGCGGAKDPAAMGASNDKLFQSADPQVKGCWDAAMASLKTNGYAAAILNLQEITKGTNSVTPEQMKAANETVTAVSDKMYEGANKGNAAALQSIEELRKGMSR